MAGTTNTQGANNTFVGADAGHNNTTGNANTFVGSNAGSSNTTGYNNIFIGQKTGESNTLVPGIFSSVQMLGSRILQVEAIYSLDLRRRSEHNWRGSTFIGLMAGQSNNTGNLNTFIGYVSGQANTTGGPTPSLGMALVRQIPLAELTPPSVSLPGEPRQKATPILYRESDW